MSLNGPKFPRKNDGSLDLEAFKLLSPETHEAIRDNMNDAERLEAQLAFRASAAADRLEKAKLEKELADLADKKNMLQTQFNQYLDSSAQALVNHMKNDKIAIEPKENSKKSCCSIM